MKKYVFTFVLFATPALAQNPAQNVTMSITVAEAQQVFNLLGQQPWKDVNPLMQKLINQINPQLTPPAPPPAPEAPKFELPSHAPPPIATPVPMPRPKPPVISPGEIIWGSYWGCSLPRLLQLRRQPTTP